MKRALSAMAVMVVAVAGVLVSATPAAAEELATCLVNSEDVTIDTTDNNATIEYTLYCPVIVGYQSPATAVCFGEGTGDRSSAIFAWTSTEDECVFSYGSAVIGVAIIQVSRQYALSPLIGTSLETGGGLDIDGFLAPSIQNSEVAGHFTGSDGALDITKNALVPAPYVLLTE
jgi:hypothetical protein